MLKNLDDNVGRILDFLATSPDPRNPKSNLLDNTLILFISDNGGLGGYKDAGVPGSPEITNQFPLQSGKGSLFEGGIREIMPNQTLSAVVASNLRQLNDLEYSEEDMHFAARLLPQIPNAQPLESIRNVEDVSGTVGKGSTDVGDVSWVVPTTGFSTSCWIPGTPGHSWQAVACGGTRIAEKGMHLAARTLAVSIFDLLHSQETLQQAKAELQRRRGTVEYESLMQPGQTAPLNYRNASKQ